MQHLCSFSWFFYSKDHVQNIYSEWYCGTWLRMMSQKINRNEITTSTTKSKTRKKEEKWKAKTGDMTRKMEQKWQNINFSQWSFNSNVKWNRMRLPSRMFLFQTEIIFIFFCVDLKQIPFEFVHKMKFVLCHSFIHSFYVNISSWKVFSMC